MKNYEPICGKCGDIGYEEALVSCFMCQDAYEHRYCFIKASDIFKDVKWACEDCLPIAPKKRSPKKISNSPSRRSQRVVSKTPKFADEFGGKISSPAAKRAKQNPESRNETEGLEFLNTDGSSECGQRLGCIPEENGNEDTEIPCEIEVKRMETEGPEFLNTDGSSECGQRLKCIPEEIGNEDTEIPCEIEVKKPKLSDEKMITLEEAKGEGTRWIDLTQSLLDSTPVLQQDCNLKAQPIMDPIWKGSLRVCYKNLRRVNGVKAHLSTLACPKAQQEASFLPLALEPHIVPRSTVWPKSFQKAEPNEENIGLYFFSDRDSDGGAFDSLVNEMISDDLAMCCAVKNAELLVFTSIKLPCDYWRFDGKRYLWGVFRAKQNPSSC